MSSSIRWVIDVPRTSQGPRRSNISGSKRFLADDGQIYPRVNRDSQGRLSKVLKVIPTSKNGRPYGQ